MSHLACNVAFLCELEKEDEEDIESLYEKHEWLEEFVEAKVKKSHDKAVSTFEKKVQEMFPYDKQFATIARASISNLAKELTEGETK